MKRPLLITVSLLSSAALSAQQVIISENFDSHAAGNLVVQTIGAPWATWSGPVGSAEDAPISDAIASSGTLSARFTNSSTTGGPVDVVLQLGNRTTGRYALGWAMYVAGGKGGYFNIQKSMTPGQSWALDVTFRSSGVIELSANAQAGVVTNYTQDEWFIVGMVIDLNAGTGILTLDGQVAATWLTTTASGAAGTGLNQIGGVNFFAYAGGDLGDYYIDDVTFVDITGVGISELNGTAASAFPNPTEGAFVVDATGLSSAATMTVADLTGRTITAPRQLLRRGAVSRAEVDLSGHPNGVYFVRIQDGERELVRRVTKH
jgi:hypothetical protein